MKYNKVDSGFIVLDKDTGKFFAGLNQWNSQLRKAKIYYSQHWINEFVNLPVNKNKNLEILPVKISIE